MDPLSRHRHQLIRPRLVTASGCLPAWSIRMPHAPFLESVPVDQHLRRFPSPRRPAPPWPAFINITAPPQQRGHCRCPVQGGWGTWSRGHGTAVRSSAGTRQRWRTERMRLPRSPMAPAICDFGERSRKRGQRSTSPVVARRHHLAELAGGMSTLRPRDRQRRRLAIHVGQANLGRRTPRCPMRSRGRRRPSQILPCLSTIARCRQTRPLGMAVRS